MCQEQQLGVIPYSPLAGGFLTGKYRRDAPLPDSDRAEGIQKRYLNERVTKIFPLTTLKERSILCSTVRSFD